MNFQFEFPVYFASRFLYIYYSLFIIIYYYMYLFLIIYLSVFSYSFCLFFIFLLLYFYTSITITITISISISIIGIVLTPYASSRRLPQFHWKSNETESIIFIGGRCRPSRGSKPTIPQGETLTFSRPNCVKKNRRIYFLSFVKIALGWE